MVALFFHSHEVIRITGISSQHLTPRFHTLGKQVLLPTLAFGSWEFIFYRIRVPLIFLILAVVGLGLEIKRFYIILSFILFAPLIMFIGTSVYNDYWGIIYMPFILITAPVVLKYL